MVKKEKNENLPKTATKDINVRKQIRNATATALKGKKWVQVGGTK